MSAEPHRRSAYQADLRWRIVYQKIGMNLSFQRISSNLNIAASTAHRIYSLFERSGNVDSAPIARREEKILDERSELYVVGLVLDNPAMYLSEIRQEIHDVLNIDVSVSTICRLLQRYGITRKKIVQVAIQRCDALRGAFRAQCYMLNPNMFVWADETGTDRRDSIRKYGYDLRGTRAVSHRFLSRGKRINVIAAMSTSGIIATNMTSTTVCGDTFFDFLRGSLIPNMLPFDGLNERSVLILDNCSVHHVEAVTDLLQQAGIVALFLPPYSPDLNPIEEVFSFVKGYLKKHDAILQHIPDPSDIIKDAFDSVSVAQCNSFIEHAGYI